MRLSQVLSTIRCASVALGFLFASTSLAADGPALVDAARDGNLEVVRSLLKGGADPNQAAPDESTAVHWAVHRDNLPMLNALLDAGARPNYFTRYKITPLTLAAQNGNAPIVEGGKVNESTDEYETAATIAEAGTTPGIGTNANTNTGTGTDGGTGSDGTGIDAASTSEATSNVQSQLSSLSDTLDEIPALLGPNGNGIGSNSWVVTGSRSSTGAPILANDPHLAVGIPSTFYQVGLHCRAVTSSCPFDVSGFSFSGVPGSSAICLMSSRMVLSSPSP